jgi:hypothetical protein
MQPDAASGDGASFHADATECLNGKPISIGKFAYDKISISPDSAWLLI